MDVLSNSGKLQRTMRWLVPFLALSLALPALADSGLGKDEWNLTKKSLKDYLNEGYKVVGYDYTERERDKVIIHEYLMQKESDLVSCIDLQVMGEKDTHSFCKERVQPQK